MIGLLILIMLSANPAFAAEDTKPTPACDVATQFNDPKFQPSLDRLKGTVSMSGKFVCSAALVILKGRSSVCSRIGVERRPLQRPRYFANPVAEQEHRRS